MSRGVNKVILIGNLGADPKIRPSHPETIVAHIRIATTRAWRDKVSGELREDTEWHRIVFFGRLAEVARDYLRKGRRVYVEGRLKTSKWQDQETGSDRYMTEVIANELQILDSRETSSPMSSGATIRKQVKSADRPVGSVNQQSQTYTSGASLAEWDADDVPF